MELNYSVIIVTLVFILLDVVTGIVQALSNKEINSEKLRQGLFHKMAFVFAIALAYSIEYGMTVINLGFDAPIAVPVCAYLCLTEIVSILENLCKLNPELANSKFIGFFSSTNVEVGEDE